MQELSIAPTSMMTAPDSKVKKSTSKSSLMKASNRHNNKDINMGETALLVEQEPIQVEDIPIGNSPSETLLSKNVSKVD